jgi:hypothetical protein
VTDTTEGPTGVVRIEAPDGTVLNVGFTPEQIRQVAALFMNMVDELDALG